MLKYLFILFLNVFVYFFSFGQINKIEFIQIDSLIKINTKPVLVFVHTDWCKYCLAMKQSSLKNKEVIELINKSFYFIEFNAEEKKDIIFKQKVYRYIPNGNNTGTNELTQVLAQKNGEINYPSLVFLNQSLGVIHVQSGFTTFKELIYILNKILLNIETTIQQ